MSITRGQTFKQDRPCPVCLGGEDDRRGKGRRCFGFVSTDGQYIHCTREEFAGDTPFYSESQTYAHKRYGPCRCGKTHGELPIMPVPAERKNPSDEKLGPIVAEYLYRDLKGAVAYRVTRHDQGDGEKTYRPWYWKDTRWVMGNGSVPRHLYHLPDIEKAPKDTTVYIVEGEKCADALASVGLLATTNTGGALKWDVTPRRERHDTLRGRSVAILPDNDSDDVGQKHAERVAADLIGIAGSIKIVTLPDLPLKGDVVNWLAKAGTREQLEALTAATPEWAPAAENEDASPGTNHQAQGRYRLLSRGELRNLPPPAWLIQGIVPFDALSFLVAAPKSYKSFLALAWACCIVTGMPWLGRKILKQGPVVYLAGEGLGGINKRVTAWEAHHGLVAEDLYTIGDAVLLLSPEAVTELIEVLRSITPLPIMVVIDTLSRAMVGGDPLSSKEIMLAIAAADRIRKEIGCHVLIVHHKNKSDDILGSISIPGGADTIIDIAADGDDLTITCAKQKDFDEFPALELQVLHVSVDDDPAHDSQVLIAADRESDAALLHLKRSERITLESLNGFGLEGATATEWEKATVGPGLGQRTFYKAKEQLTVKGFVGLQARGQSRRIQITELGRQALVIETTAPTAPTATALHVQGVQSISMDTPPPKGGVSNGLLGDMQSGEEITPKSGRPLPKGKCMECHTVNWARMPNGQPICATCYPPKTWAKAS